MIYLCFLKVWKALSLLKLERLSVAGWKGTEWMKVETEGESWNREEEIKTTHELNSLRVQKNTGFSSIIHTQMMIL